MNVAEVYLFDFPLRLPVELCDALAGDDRRGSNACRCHSVSILFLFSKWTYLKRQIKTQKQLNAMYVAAAPLGRGLARTILRSVPILNTYSNNASSHQAVFKS